MAYSAAKIYNGKATVGRFNVDAGDETAEKYEVVSIPTTFLFKGGKVVGKKIGVLDQDVLNMFVSQGLA